MVKVLCYPYCLGVVPDAIKKQIFLSKKWAFIMKPHTRSILQELTELSDNRNIDSLIESRATNVINSAINLLESINKHYNEDQAGELSRRFINAIKGADQSKFTRGIRKIREARNYTRQNLQ